MKKILEYFNKPGKMLYGIALLSVMVLSLSYGVFVIQSNQYNASELLVGNLLYGITVHDTDKQELSNPVTVPNGETTLYITISSVNSITSKYTLAYDNNNVTVSASNKSGWNASGSMSNFQDYAYTKTVKVVVTNNTGTNQTVTFAAFGGYSYNSASNIPLGNGYYTVANFTDVTQVSGELLTDIVEEDTNCTSTNCLYGGEATTNYFSFEQNGDLYRIIGTYTLNNEKTTKIASNDLVQTTTPSNLNTTLSTIANTLETDYIYNTNLFNCQGTTSLTCTSYNNFNSNIGILSLDEYKQLEGDNENNYLYNSNSYYLLNNNTLVTNTNQTETPTSAYIRPTMYLTEETQVEGSGTVSDPYTIASDSDFNLVAIMVEQTAGQEDYTNQNAVPTAGIYEFNSSSSYCEVNGVVDSNVTITYVNNSLTFAGVTTKGTKCYAYFDIEAYVVTTNITGGTTTSTNPQQVVIGRTATFNISANTGYLLSGATVSGTGCTLSSDKATLTVSNVTGNVTCIVTIPAESTSIAVASNNTSYGTVSNLSSSTIAYGGSVTVTVTPTSGYYLSAGSCNPSRGYKISNMSTGTSATGSQTVTITNNGATAGTTCTFTFTKIPVATIKINVTNGTTSTSSVSVVKGNYTDVTITPNSGLYLNNAICGEGLTLSNVTAGTSATGAQTVRITNSSVTSGSRGCYFYFAKCTYTETAVAAAYINNGYEGTYTATYVCNGNSSSNCKIAQCEYTGTGSYSTGKYAVCNGGENGGLGPTFMCTNNNSGLYYNNLHYYCNASLPSMFYDAYGGGLASSTTHACS